MSKMPYISWLCENNKKKELIEEVGIEMAEEFIEAHRKMRKNKDNPAYKKLNEIHNQMQMSYSERN